MLNVRFRPLADIGKRSVNGSNQRPAPSPIHCIALLYGISNHGECCAYEPVRAVTFTNPLANANPASPNRYLPFSQIMFSLARSKYGA